jgi:hypothetical protein
VSEREKVGKYGDKEIDFTAKNRCTVYIQTTLPPTSEDNMKGELGPFKGSKDRHLRQGDFLLGGA